MFKSYIVYVYMYSFIQIVIRDFICQFNVILNIFSHISPVISFFIIVYNLSIILIVIIIILLM